MTNNNAPIRTPVQTVPAEWIDYNGHMNVAYYLLAIDQALEAVFDELGAGEALTKTHRMGTMGLVNQINYLDELLEGQQFCCDFQILDCDHKRVHYFVTMHHLEKQTVAATMEALSINVDLEARKSVPYPKEVLARIETMFAAHKTLPRPATAGATIGIRR